MCCFPVAPSFVHLVVPDVIVTLAVSKLMLPYILADAVLGIPDVAPEGDEVPLGAGGWESPEELHRQGERGIAVAPEDSELHGMLVDREVGEIRRGRCHRVDCSAAAEDGKQEEECALHQATRLAIRREPESAVRFVALEVD